MDAPYFSVLLIKDMKHNLPVYAELSLVKRPVPDARKYLELSYLHEALA